MLLRHSQWIARTSKLLSCPSSRPPTLCSDLSIAPVVPVRHLSLSVVASPYASSRMRSVTALAFHLSCDLLFLGTRHIDCLCHQFEQTDLLHSLRSLLPTKFVPVLKLDFMHSRIKYWVVVCRHNWEQAVLLIVLQRYQIALCHLLLLGARVPSSGKCHQI